jgi:hypothetical protein
MRTARVVLALTGLAATVWGLVLAVRFALHSVRDGGSAIGFFVGGPVVHDAVVAPVVGVVGLLVSRHVPEGWRTPVKVAAAMSGVLALLAVPALWRAHAGLPNPGLDDRDYGVGLLVALAVVWLLALAGGLVRWYRDRPPRPARAHRPARTRRARRTRHARRRGVAPSSDGRSVRPTSP